MNDISSRHIVGLYWVHVHAGIEGNEITDELTRESLAQILRCFQFWRHEEGVRKYEKVYQIAR
jgi:ribonuclease HI